MSFADFAGLPAAARVTFVVMLWPAIWAVAGTLVALTSDIRRLARRHRDFQREPTWQPERPIRPSIG
jgi:hypothetical protein